VSVTPVVHLLNRHRKPGCRSITTAVEGLGIEAAVGDHSTTCQNVKYSF
jgi:hypothetical protein